MFRGEHEPKGGGAACVAGRAGEGRCLYKNASRQTDLWMAKRDDRTILRGGQGEPRPALCAHAWDTEHAGAVFPDSSCAKYQEAGGLFLSRFSSLSIILPLRLCLNAGVCQWSEQGWIQPCSLSFMRKCVALPRNAYNCVITRRVAVTCRLMRRAHAGNYDRPARKRAWQECVPPCPLSCPLYSICKRLSQLRPADSMPCCRRHHLSARAGSARRARAYTRSGSVRR